MIGSGIVRRGPSGDRELGGTESASDATRRALHAGERFLLQRDDPMRESGGPKPAEPRDRLGSRFDDHHSHLWNASTCRAFALGK